MLFWHGLAPDGSGLDARPLAEAVGDALRVVAPDAPGFGGSPPLPADGYRGASLAALAEHLLDELAIERCAFVGESWGAWVGCYLAAAAPGRISALVLLDAGYIEPADWRPRLAPATLADCVELACVRDIPRPEAWGAAFHATLQAPYVSTTYGAIDAAGLPVLLLVAGEADDVTRRASERGLRRFDAALEGAEVLVLEGVGHDVLEDATAARAVAEWLSSRRYR